MKPAYTHRTICRICEISDLVKILDLGMMPLANAFLQKEELAKPEPTFPLALYFCQNCGFAQLLDIVDPKLLFKHYYYLTSTSKPLADHFVALADMLAQRFVKLKEELVVEIGGNDAVLLGRLQGQTRVLNVDPAQNIAQRSRDRGVETVEEFFDEDVAKKILAEYGPAKIVVASNVFAHADDVKSILKGVEALLQNDGIFVVETHWVANLLGKIGIGGFDQIYHEHLSYFSLSALKAVASAMGLKIFDAEVIPIHGRSLQVYMCKDNRPADPSVEKLLEEEERLGLGNINTYKNFAEDVAKNKKELKETLFHLKKQNRIIAGYGAPAKANTLLNYFEIGNDVLDYIVDDSPLKQGSYTPGTHIPVLSRDALFEKQPDDILVLAWNYADSILEREQDLKQKGVHFIIPIPKVKVL